jgi:hypothetical protein
MDMSENLPQLEPPRRDEDADSTSADRSNAPSEQKRKDQLIYRMIYLAAFAGVAAARFGMLIETLVNLAIVIHAILWVQADARERGFPLTRRFLWGLRLLFIVMFPIYLFRSRGWRGFPALLVATLIVIALGFLSGLVQSFLQPAMPPGRFR